ncbi:hypothetical protein RWH43_07345 [Microbacterium sp. KSW2-21]|uniref:Multidrug transporter n=1 Tax=Microbacterium algihabitans TaxID=3075992 RepID=A0ABU3RVU2_9MICO|nr:hypothetical protein [Microbacterium sp. KSW2-21]MDU0326573.1 hypothetical protein [Microbacterium sp. KSW2-21]
MSDPDRLPVPDPAAQYTDRHDTSIAPDMEADPVEAKARRTDDLDESRADPEDRDPSI